ncbi:hypothetical protein K438DRAFT_1170232 [Mycena galopus ATCC 62051]|nr:hypothetical protein K438DRAFT_1170232 [Mycena galopus ATCC 62051]
MRLHTTTSPVFFLAFAMRQRAYCTQYFGCCPGGLRSIHQDRAECMRAIRDVHWRCVHASKVFYPLDGCETTFREGFAVEQFNRRLAEMRQHIKKIDLVQSRDFSATATSS